MAYTNVWSTATPANADPALPHLDIRKLRLDIQERMETLFGVGGFSSDPVSIGASIVQFISAAQFNNLTSGGGAWTYTAGTQFGFAAPAAATYTLYCPIYIGRGATISDISIVGQTGASSSMTLTLESINCTTATVAQATLATATMAAGTNQSTKSSGVISVTLDSTPTNYIMYYLKMVVVSGGAATTWFQGVTITYSRSSIAQAL